MKDIQYVELTFKAKTVEGVDLSKYKKDGQVKVPNTADVILNDVKQTSNEVTVTPPKPKEPTIDKKINENLDSFQTFDGNHTTTILQQQYQVMLLITRNLWFVIHWMLIWNLQETWY